LTHFTVREIIENTSNKKGIHFAGKPLGRPKKVTDQNRAELKQEKKQRREDYRQRIPIEGKFGQGKHAYQLGYIRAKRADTSVAWINSIFLVMNLMVLLKIFFAPWKQVMLNTLLRVSCYGQTLRRYFGDNPARLSLMPVKFVGLAFFLSKETLLNCTFNQTDFSCVHTTERDELYLSQQYFHLPTS
jgi:hypothetical protein